MDLPLDISFHDVPYSRAIEDAVSRQASKSAVFCEEILRFRISLIGGKKHIPHNEPPVVLVDVHTREWGHFSHGASGEDLHAALQKVFFELNESLREARALALVRKSPLLHRSSQKSPTGAVVESHAPQEP